MLWRGILDGVIRCPVRWSLERPLENPSGLNTLLEGQINLPIQSKTSKSPVSRKPKTPIL